LFNRRLSISVPYREPAFLLRRARGPLALPVLHRIDLNEPDESVFLVSWRDDRQTERAQIVKRRGLTLLELLVVLLILIALATIVVPTIGMFGSKSQQVTTRENLLRLQELLVDRYLPDMNELPRPSDLTGPPARVNHPQLRYLFVNPDTEDITKTAGATLLSVRKWNGPYVKHGGARYQLDAAKGFDAAYGVGDAVAPAVVRGDPAILDAWGRPIVIQEPDESGGYAPTDEERTYTRLVSAGPNGVIDTLLTVLMPTDVERGDDILIFLFRHDEFGEDFLSLER